MNGWTIAAGAWAGMLVGMLAFGYRAAVYRRRMLQRANEQMRRFDKAVAVQRALDWRARREPQVPAQLRARVYRPTGRVIRLHGQATHDLIGQGRPGEVQSGQHRAVRTRRRTPT